MKKDDKEQKHLNTPQVYQTKQLVEILKKSPFEIKENLIKYISTNRENKISERTFHRIKRLYVMIMALSLNIPRLMTAFI